MTNEITVRLEGADTANKILRHLEFKIQRRVVTAAVRAGMAEVRKEARARAPVDTGQLQRQLGVSVSMDRVSGKVSGKLRAKRFKGQKKKGAAAAGRYVHLVVAGTRPHEIKPSAAAALVVGGSPYTRVDHPGAKPRPFLDEAARAAFPHAVRAFTFKLDERIAVEAAKARAMR